MNVLALDLGSRIGWSVFSIDGDRYSPLDHGYVDLVFGVNSSQRSQTVKTLAKACDHTTRAYDPRPDAMFRLCKDLQETYKPEIIAFEDVQFFNSLYQTQLWGSLRGTMWAAFDYKHTWRAYDVGDVKKFATGRGDAKKEHMIASLWDAGITCHDDNEADACWIGMLACERHFDPSAQKVSRLMISNLPSGEIP